MSANMVRSTALRAGGACVRCRKGKTKCVYENGRAPCKNCAKGMHECYLPSESMAHHHGQSPARHTTAHRPPRDSLPGPAAGTAPDARQPTVASANARHTQSVPEKLTPELIAECERVVNKTFPACVVFHKTTLSQQLRSGSLDPALVCALLACAARSSPALIRRFGTPTAAAESYAQKAITQVNSNLDHTTLADVQALCLVVIHEWGTRNAVRAYIYLGQAARMIQMVRILHSHHSGDSNDQFRRDEEYRRTLWLLYILDCMLTSTPGRFAALTVQDTNDVSLPCADMDFHFGNAVHVKSLGQQLDTARYPPPALPSSDVGEFGYIVVAATIWRDVVSMLTTSTLPSFREEECIDLINKIEGLRASLPMRFVDKPNQINNHMTLGSGHTFAMLHCYLHCASIFVHRRRLLQEVTSPHWNLEGFRMSQKCHDIVDRLFTASHGITSLLDAVEAGSEKEYAPCFPIFMLFSSFTASATVAYLSLKGLTPPQAVETASHIVGAGLRFMTDGTETWPLMASWLRHLSVMQRVISNDAAQPTPYMPPHAIKDEIASNADTNPEAMEYNTDTLPPPLPRGVSESARGDSEPPTAIPRRPGVATINGGGVSTPGASPPHGQAPTSDVKPPSPESNGTEGPATSQDMTAPELCNAFERQLLDLDDLAAFMGGGV